MNAYRKSPQMGIWMDELLVDNFAGGGGASTGIEAAAGRPVDIAINHDADAVSMHTVNHPHTRHYCESVWDVDPREVTQGMPVGLAWFSPDCKHFSKAKGGTPVQKEIRGLAWVAVRWAATVRPRIIILENVEEFVTWGPVVDGKPCQKRKGKTFRSFLEALKSHGYAVDWKMLRACDFGAPTIRRRLFLIARCDGQPIVWPEPTHGDPSAAGFKKSGLKPWRTAADIIDWSIPCPSIFDRKRPLAANTLARIAKGIQRFVLDDPKPFIVRIGQTGFSGDGLQYEADQPLTTIVSKAEHCLAMPFVTKFRAGSTGFDVKSPLHTVTAGGEQVRPGTAGAMGLVSAHVSRQFGCSVGSDMDDPIGAVTAGGGGKSALVSAFLAQHNTGVTGRRADAPVSTVMQTGSHQAVVAAHLLSNKGTTRRHQSVTQPVPAICAGGNHANLVAALLAPYYGSGSGETGRKLSEPTPTITGKDRLQLITVEIDGESYVLTDIGMRMLQPHELYAAQGFPPDYIIDRDAAGIPRPKYQQVAKCGNSVCPPVAEALARANLWVAAEAAVKKKVAA